jgi:hypothetical protein
MDWRVFESGLLRREFGAQREEVTGRTFLMRSDIILHPSPNIISNL